LYKQRTATINVPLDQLEQWQKVEIPLPNRNKKLTFAKFETKTEKEERLAAAEKKKAQPAAKPAPKPAQHANAFNAYVAAHTAQKHRRDSDAHSQASGPPGTDHNQQSSLTRPMFQSPRRANQAMAQFNQGMAAQKRLAVHTWAPGTGHTIAAAPPAAPETPERTGRDDDAMEEGENNETPGGGRGKGRGGKDRTPAGRGGGRR
jgi:hypothetical protein